MAAGIPTFRTSRTVRFVNLLPPERRRARKNIHMRGEGRVDDQVAYEHRPHYALHDPLADVAADDTDMQDMFCMTFHRRVVTYSKSQLTKLSKVDDKRWQDAKAAWNTQGGLDNRALHCPVDAGNAGHVDSWGNRFIGVSSDNIAYFWRRYAYRRVLSLMLYLCCPRHSSRAGTPCNSRL